MSEQASNEADISVRQQLLSDAYWEGDAYTPEDLGISYSEHVQVFRNRQAGREISKMVLKSLGQETRQAAWEGDALPIAAPGSRRILKIVQDYRMVYDEDTIRMHNALILKRSTDLAETEIGADQLFDAFAGAVLERLVYVGLGAESFVTQGDKIVRVGRTVLYAQGGHGDNLFTSIDAVILFSGKRKALPLPFPRIPVGSMYDEPGNVPKRMRVVSAEVFDAKHPYENRWRKPRKQVRVPLPKLLLPQPSYGY